MQVIAEPEELLVDLGLLGESGIMTAIVCELIVPFNRLIGEEQSAMVLELIPVPLLLRNGEEQFSGTDNGEGGGPQQKLWRN